MMLIVSKVKHPLENSPLVIDFSSMLVAGDTLTSATCTCTVWSGVDANPSALLSGVPSISSNVATQFVTGGVDGCTYMVICKGLTAGGYAPIIQTYLSVVSNTL